MARAVEDWLDAAVKTSCGARSSPFGLPSSHPRKVTSLPLSRLCAILRLTTPDKRHDQNKINYYELIQCCSCGFASHIGILLPGPSNFVTCQSIDIEMKFFCDIFSENKTCEVLEFVRFFMMNAINFRKRMTMFVCCIESVFNRWGILFERVLFSRINHRFTLHSFCVPPCSLPLYPLLTQQCNKRMSFDSEHHLFEGQTFRVLDRKLLQQLFFS